MNKELANRICKINFELRDILFNEITEDQYDIIDNLNDCVDALDCVLDELLKK